jgi:hypothetical protein
VVGGHPGAVTRYDPPMASHHGRRSAATATVMALLLAACGLLQPTPARFRPPLPESEPLPGVAVEDVVAELEQRGFACGFDRGGDVSSGWHCRLGEQGGAEPGEGDFFDVALRSDQTGPITGIFSYRSIQLGPDTGPDPAVLDREAAMALHANVIELVVPEDLRPTEAELLEGVQRNFPIELGDGWFLGFDRNSISRSLNVVYSSEGR